MTLTQLISIVIIVALAVLPSILAAWADSSQKTEPEAYDYDLR